MILLNVYCIALLELMETLRKIINVCIVILQYSIAHLAQIQQNVNFLLT